MKIECSKNEWAIIEMSLCQNFGTATTYNDPEFECCVSDIDGRLLFKAQGKLTPDKDTRENRRIAKLDLRKIIES